MVGKNEWKRLAGIVAASLIVASCNNLFNSDNYNVMKVVASPTEALPLANGSLTIADFLSKKDSANIHIDTDGTIYLEYDQTLKSQDINSLITFPNKNFNQSVSVPAATLPSNNNEVKYVTQTFVLDFGFSPEKLSEIQLKTTSLSVKATLSQGNSNLEAEVSLPTFKLNNVAYSQRFPFSNQFTNVDLSNYIATLNSNQFQLIFSVYVKAHQGSINVKNSTATIYLNFNGIDYKYVIGFLGDQSTNLHGDTIAFNAFGSSLANANVSFADPQIPFTLINDYGIPLKVTFNPLKAENSNGNQLTVNTNPASPITVNIPTQLGQSATTSVAVTNTNQLIDFAPNKFYYKASGHINQGLSSGNNFCADTSKFRINFHAKIPLYGKASNIILADTVSVDLSDQKNSNIQSGAIVSKINNQLPLDAIVQLYLADDNKIIFDSLFTTAQTSLIKASQVDSNGELVSSTTSNEEIDIPVDKLNEIFNAKNIIIRTKMNTAKDSNGNYIDVRFKASYKMDANFSLKLKLKYEQDL